MLSALLPRDLQVTCKPVRLLIVEHPRCGRAAELPKGIPTLLRRTAILSTPSLALPT